MSQANPHFAPDWTSGNLALGLTTGNAGYDRAIATLALLLLLLAVRHAFGTARRKPQSKSPRPSPKATSGHSTVQLDTSRPRDAAQSMADPRDQMIAISAVSFETIPLLNREEARLLPILESATRSFGNGHRVMAQTSLGEIIRPKDCSASPTIRNAAYASINSKRLDFAIFDRFGRLVAAIEYQGTGHHADPRGRGFMRDAVKREAVRKAGVPYVEILPDFLPTDVTARIQSILMQNAARNRPPETSH